MDLISSRFDFTVTAHFSSKAFWLLDLSLFQKVKQPTDECPSLSSRNHPQFLPVLLTSFT